MSARGRACVEDLGKEKVSETYFTLSTLDFCGTSRTKLRGGGGMPKCGEDATKRD